MKAGILIYAYLLADPLANLLDHIASEVFQVGTSTVSKHVYLFLHSQEPDVVKVCERHAQYEHVHYFPYGANRGLSKSVNEGMIQGYQQDGMDVMLTANDDMLPSKGDIDKIATYAYWHRNYWLVEGMGTIGHDATRQVVAWALAAVNPITFETIGYWDENFFPAYYEDVDIRYRAAKAGLKAAVVENTNIRHQGSATLHTLTDTHEFDLAFDRSQAYYMQKWGGNVGVETFDRPFNDPAYDLTISQANRHAPYGKHNRRDLVVTEAV